MDMNTDRDGGAPTCRKGLAAGGVLLAVALAGAVAWGAAGAASRVGSADADAAPALGNTLGNNDTAEKGELAVYDPQVEAAASGGEQIEGSEEEKLQQERIAGGAVGAVVSQELEPLEGVVDGTPGDYVATYGMDFQAPDLPQAVIDAVEGGSLEGLPENHLTANLTIDDCASCHAILG